MSNPTNPTVNASPWNLSAWAVNHSSFVLFLLLMSGVAGLYSFLKLGRAEDPTFTIKTMTITVAWPGATAQQMQEIVADRIEKKLQDLPYFDFAKTFSRPGYSWILLNLKDFTPPDQVSELWYQTRKKVQDIRSEMPEGVVGPFFNDEFGDVYSGLYALKGDGYTQAELKHVAEMARQRIMRVSDVDKVSIIASRPEKVFVEFSHSKLASLGITPNQIFESIAKQNAIQPSGSIDTQDQRVFLRVAGTFDAVKQVSEVPISTGGKLLRLGDIADVVRGYEEPATYTMRFNGSPALGIGVVMSTGGNMLRMGEELKKEVDSIRCDLPAGMELDAITFQPHVVEESVTEFVRSFVEALAIVLVVSFVSLGFRTGIVVALSVPSVLAITLLIMYILGMNLDRISLGSLIIALGLLVDDAIIAVEMMVVKMEQGMDRFQAATYAWSSTAFPMLTGTLVTAIGFVPVGFANSAAGEYAGGIFWVVGIALMVSWLVAVVFTPYLGAQLLPDFSKKHAGKDHDIYDSPMYRRARRFLEACLARPKMVVSLTLLLFLGTLSAFPMVKQQFFPQSARHEIFIELRLPEGSSFKATERAVAETEKILANEPGIESYSSFTGGGPPRFFLSLDPDFPSSSFAKILVVSKGLKEREELISSLRKKIAEDPEFSNLRGRVTRLDFGPPVGFPVQYRVVGPDAFKVREIAKEVQKKMQSIPETRDVNLEWDELAKSVKLDIDQEKARMIGLAPQDISRSLQTLLNGIPVSQYREGIELIDVVARAIPEERLNLDQIPSINLMTPIGKSVPLSQIATITPQSEEPVLWRRNRDLTLTVRSDMQEGLQAPDVAVKLRPLVASIQLPHGYRIEEGGAIEESTKANASIFGVFPIMGVLMLTVLMAQLQSFPRMLLVVLIAPLGLIGVTIFLLLFDAPFGFVALLGVISLAGMDMRNSVILMDQIQHDLSVGIEPWEAVVGATIRRARPVILTAATAILAMIPLSRSVFWGPMAIAIMGGLSIATFLTLINLPALYILIFRVKKQTKVAK